MPRHTDNTWLERISGYLKSLTEGSLDTKYRSEAVVSSVDDSASSVTLLSANDNRAEAVIQNDSPSTIYIKFGTTATTTDYTTKLATDGVLITEYTGRIDAIWSANSTGAAKITEVRFA